MKSKEVLVSISCITYNHTPYIRKCLDGFLMQQTNFAFEVLIHDDCSTDGTTEIIKEYEAKYPDIIKPMYEEENQYQQGKSGGSAVWNFPRAKGKYIAMCEGDDYWIDPLKLQKQVGFMEVHEEHTLCCSAGKILTNNGFTRWREVGCEQDLTPEQLILGFWGYIPTASLLFRRNMLDIYPEFCKKCAVGDRPLKLFCSLVGKIHYFNEEHVVYRYNNVSGTSWVARSAKDSSILLRMNLSLAEVEHNLDIFSEYKYTEAFNTARARRVLCVVKDDPYNAKNNFKKIHELVPDYKKYLSLKDKVLINFVLLAPSLFVGLRKLIGVIKK